MINKKRVIVAMSGGVDSAVAAALLKKDGFEVIGITMCFNIAGGERKRPSCCGIEGIEDAKRVAARLDIPHYVLNFGKILQEKVIEDFCLEYSRGRTPNPCIRCNRYLKFGALLRKAREFDAEYFATGHYARITQDPKTRRYLLRKGKDKQKDQSYFLYSIQKEILPFIKMPLGDFTKEKTREIARQFKLPIAAKPASQEICFIDTDYRQFLIQQIKKIYGNRIPKTMQPGKIKDRRGNVLGEHKGTAFYTIGQREGLGIAVGYPLYVVDIDARHNTLIVGKEEDILAKGLIAKKLNFFESNHPTKKIEVKTKIRYNHQEVKSFLIPLSEDIVKVVFTRPQRAVTPGQAAVFYKNDLVLGGGIIEQGIS